MLRNSPVINANGLQLQEPKQNKWNGVNFTLQAVIFTAFKVSNQHKQLIQIKHIINIK